MTRQPPIFGPPRSLSIPSSPGGLPRAGAAVAPIPPIPIPAPPTTVVVEVAGAVEVAAEPLWLTYWLRLRRWVHRDYTASDEAAGAIVYRRALEMRRAGPGADEQVVVDVPGHLDGERVVDAFRRRVATNPDWRCVPVGWRPVADGGPLLSVDITEAPVHAIDLKIVFPGAEERHETIDRDRRRVAIGRGEQRADLTMNDVVFDDALLWIPSSTADIEWSATLGGPIVDIPARAARFVTTVLVRRRQKFQLNGGECTPLESGDILLFKQVNGDGEFAIRIRRSS